MRNITLAVDEKTYHDIRLWCALRDISVSRVVRAFLQDLPRLESVRRFPLPQAPDPRSLATRFDELEQLDPHDLELLRQQLGR
jgi:hypothetical protein